MKRLAWAAFALTAVALAGFPALADHAPIAGHKCPPGLHPVHTADGSPAGCATLA